MLLGLNVHDFAAPNFLYRICVHCVLITEKEITFLRAPSGNTALVRFQVTSLEIMEFHAT